MTTIPLGQVTDYPQEYSPDVLFAVPRSDAPQPLGLDGDLPFHGKDLWNAWELTWLDGSGKPVVATATFAFDATSPNIVESKSLKLYLGSMAMSRFATNQALVNTLRKDLANFSGADVEVSLDRDTTSQMAKIDQLPGQCVDDLLISNNVAQVDSQLLSTGDDKVSEILHSHLLRSLCPVTAQPDIGSVVIKYFGPRIDPVSFLEYVVSYRQHQDFHEACVERMFLDIKERCQPQSLTVYARYTRRGGIDINPFRSDGQDRPENLRAWRQ